MISELFTNERCWVVTDFPPSQAEQSRICEKEGSRVAQRFEIYTYGIELANAYDELNDASEQGKRWEANNALRLKSKLDPLSLDEDFLSSPDDLPQVCGVAFGFDRLMMLRHRLRSLKTILPISWESYIKHSTEKNRTCQLTLQTQKVFLVQTGRTS